MEYDQPGYGNVEANLEEDGVNNYDDYYLIAILHQLTKDCVDALIINSPDNALLLHLLQSSKQPFINHLLHSLTSTHQHNFLSICLHHLGYQVIVKLMCGLRYPYQQWTIALAISQHAFTLAKHSRCGHHVLRSCFQTLSPPPNELILLRIAENCLELARDQAGCYMLQQCINYSNNELAQLREVLISPLIENAYDLSTHPFGNYVIQFIVQLDGANIGLRIINKLRNKFVALSMDKFGSNVVEQCFFCCEGSYEDIIFEFLENNDHQNQLIQICTNQYGNYVIQKAMSVAKGKTYQSLVRAIKSHWFVLKLHPFGRKVISKWDKKKSKSQ